MAINHLLTIYQKICDAIAFAHSKRVIHRDLKPENVMVGEYGEVQVMDWGLAKVLAKKKGPMLKKQVPVKSLPPAAAGKAATPLVRPVQAIDSVRKDAGADLLKTRGGVIMGTPEYMAPEQAMGKAEELDERSDIYALGAILYTILTLQPPLKGKDLDELLAKVASGKITDPRSYVKTRKSAGGGRIAESFLHLPGGDVPESLSAVAMKALALKPAARYVSVRLLQKDIEAYQNGFATGAERAGTWKLFTLFVRRNKAASITAAAMLTLLIAAMAIYTAVNVRERLRAEKALADFQAEQARRQSDRRSSAPSMLRSAKTLIEQRQFNAALDMLRTALEYDPNLGEAWLLQVAVLEKNGKRTAALELCQAYVNRLPNDANAAPLLAICQKACRPDSSAVADTELSTILKAHELYTFAADFVDVPPERLELFRKQLTQAWPTANPNRLEWSAVSGLSWNFEGASNVTDLSPLKGMPLNRIGAGRTQISDLSPLKGMPLTDLGVDFTRVSDLSPLKGMPLNRIEAGDTPISDLSPLKGMPLTELNVAATRVSDLSPLKGMPLTSLTLARASGVSDLRPLKGMPLTKLNLTDTGVRDLRQLKGMSLEELGFGKENCPINDLSPLKGMPLKILDCRRSQVSDLSPLMGMPLTWLGLDGTRVSDLSPLKGMQLVTLQITPQSITKGMDAIREMKTLTAIGNMSPAEFWKKYDAGEFGK